MYGSRTRKDPCLASAERAAPPTRPAGSGWPPLPTGGLAVGGRGSLNGAGSVHAVSAQRLPSPILNSRLRSGLLISGTSPAPSGGPQQSLPEMCLQPANLEGSEYTYMYNEIRVVQNNTVDCVLIFLFHSPVLCSSTVLVPGH